MRGCEGELAEEVEGPPNAGGASEQEAPFAPARRRRRGHDRSAPYREEEAEEEEAPHEQELEEEAEPPLASGWGDDPPPPAGDATAQLNDAWAEFTARSANDGGLSFAAGAPDARTPFDGGLGRW